MKKTNLRGNPGSSTSSLWLCLFPCVVRKPTKMKDKVQTDSGFNQQQSNLDKGDNSFDSIHLEMHEEQFHNKKQYSSSSMNPTWSKTFFGDVDEAVPAEPAEHSVIGTEKLGRSLTFPETTNDILPGISAGEIVTTNKNSVSDICKSRKTNKHQAELGVNKSLVLSDPSSLVVSSEDSFPSSFAYYSDISLSSLSSSSVSNRKKYDRDFSSQKAVRYESKSSTSGTSDEFLNRVYSSTTSDEEIRSFKSKPRFKRNRFRKSSQKENTHIEKPSLAVVAGVMLYVVGKRARKKFLKYFEYHVPDLD